MHSAPPLPKQPSTQILTCTLPLPLSPQLHAMQYGTVPIVASTGGLVDTVKEGVTGFHMGKLDPDELLPEDADAVAATMSRATQVRLSGRLGGG